MLCAFRLAQTFRCPVCHGLIEHTWPSGFPLEPDAGRVAAGSGTCPHCSLPVVDAAIPAVSRRWERRCTTRPLHRERPLRRRSHGSGRKPPVETRMARGRPRAGRDNRQFSDPGAGPKSSSRAKFAMISTWSIFSGLLFAPWFTYRAWLRFAADFGLVFALRHVGSGASQGPKTRGRLRQRFRAGPAKRHLEMPMDPRDVARMLAK